MLTLGSRPENARHCCSEAGGRTFQCFFAPLVTRYSLFQEDETKPEDCIPDVPGNEHAREFLAHAPTRGLWMPLGKEVKVMQCESGGASRHTPEHASGPPRFTQRASLFNALSPQCW